MKNRLKWTGNAEKTSYQILKNIENSFSKFVKKFPICRLRFLDLVPSS